MAEHGPPHGTGLPRTHPVVQWEGQPLSDAPDIPVAQMTPGNATSLVSMAEPAGAPARAAPAVVPAPNSAVAEDADIEDREDAGIGLRASQADAHPDRISGETECDQGHPEAHPSFSELRVVPDGPEADQTDRAQIPTNGETLGCFPAGQKRSLHGDGRRDCVGAVSADTSQEVAASFGHAAIGGVEPDTTADPVSLETANKLTQGADSAGTPGGGPEQSPKPSCACTHAECDEVSTIESHACAHAFDS